ncbi:DAN domain family member 5 [Ctenodactylus gundi]
MRAGRLTALLGLLSGAWLPEGSGRPEPWASPRQSWATANQSRALDVLVPAPALGSWRAFLAQQDTRRQRVGGPQPGQKVAAAVSLPLDPDEVTQERCKAVPFIQVLSRPGCTATRIHNHLCFGQCSSLYVPGPARAPLVLCNSCVPTQKRWARLALWCRGASPASPPRRMRTSTVLVGGCQCSPKL